MAEPRVKPALNKRRAARLAAVQALYQVEVTGERPERVVGEFDEHRLARLLEPIDPDAASPNVDREWFRLVVTGAWAARERLDGEIERCLAPGWTLARCGFLLRAALRAGAFELAKRGDVPVKVVINEYVELAHLFFTDTEPGFINAVLDKLAPAAAERRDGLMSLGEFELIDRLLKPLAAGYPGALGLTDDAALVQVPAGAELVIAKDAIVAGVHFLPDDPPALVAGKLLRVNLSDLAAMGATPLGYLTVLARPPGLGEDWLRSFAAGLADDQRRFGCHLLGGDTVSTPGPLVLSLTILGTVAAGGALRRSGAGSGDDVWVSGTLGDAALGLRVLKGLALPEDEALQLVDRYRTPQPRLALGRALLGLATAAIDVSDGLVADLGHIAQTSGVAAVIEADALPLSDAGRGVPGAREAALGGGDDYEILFTAPATTRDALAGLSRELGLRLTRIGRIEAGKGRVRVQDADGRELSLEHTGWRHF